MRGKIATTAKAVVVTKDVQESNAEKLAKKSSPARGKNVRVSVASNAS